MSFTHPQGTRGARQPSGPFLRFINSVVARRARRAEGPVMGMNVLALTTIGRKSGVERTTPVARFATKNGGWLIVASASGAAGNPAWYHNLAANPDQVTVEIAGQKSAVTAEELHDAERDEAMKQITTESPRFAEYQVKTDREIPIIRLIPRA